MKKELAKVILLLFTFTMTTSQDMVLAKKIPISKIVEPINKEDEDKPQHTFEAIPIVDYDNDVISFYSNVHILSMEVTIKDIKGDVVYHDYLSITNGVATISLSEKEEKKAFIIELFYADMRLPPQAALWPATA